MCGEVVDCTSAFTEAMGIKDEGELECIKRACEIADRAFEDVLGAFKEGMTENEAAAELEYRMRKFGASGTSFDTIMAFGEGSSVPHHETGIAQAEIRRHNSYGLRLQVGRVLLRLHAHIPLRRR